MDGLTVFLDMGGYARFVWPAYGLAVVVMVALLIASLRATRRTEAQLAAQQKLRPSRRRHAASDAGPSKEPAP